ncbi:PilN domain-containing protein [Pararoseomonas indoligenes]|uniref:PilN domain-containing protein n=1 Tax=Roseomonas indoligenes TaxID=2820811 RepID=A0A940S9A8_9PROT|nr:PilN domain-containing protein [Pararoseomonas indoligenes]MBP0494952.1 PilN domain-containing protein [Pararoseomonas indoligenes]
MRELLSAGMRPSEDRSDALIATLQPADASLSLSRRRRGRESPAGAFSIDPAGATALRRQLGPGRRAPRLLLRVPPALVLERPVTLPLATEGELDRVLAYELDRLSPFRAEEVFWTYAVEGRDTSAGQIRLRLALVPRQGLEAALGTLRAAGMPAAGLLAPRGSGGSWSFGLEAPGTAREPAGRRLALRLAVAGCAALALVAAALPFLRQQRALAAAEARIAASRPAVTEVEALRRRTAERAGGNDALSAEAARLGRPLEALAALTAILPDDTFLTALTLRQGVATLTGQSAGAARLIAALSADPSIRSAAFAAPVTRQEGGRGEVFTIRVDFGA